MVIHSHVCNVKEQGETLLGRNRPLLPRNSDTNCILFQDLTVVLVVLKVWSCQGTAFKNCPFYGLYTHTHNISTF